MGQPGAYTAAFYKDTRCLDPERGATGGAEDGAAGDYGSRQYSRINTEPVMRLVRQPLYSSKEGFHGHIQQEPCHRPPAASSTRYGGIDPTHPRCSIGR